MDVQPRDILDFWTEIGPKKWWTRDDEVDSTIRGRFGKVHEQADAGKLDHWLDQPESALALIIILDQFSRNLYRDTPKAFAEDTRCVHLVRRVMDKKLDQQMQGDLRSFFYLPLMYSENPNDQDIRVEQMKKLGPKENIEAAEEHADIIHRFGRFPHRNAVLGRTMTAAEQSFLDDGGFSP